MRRLVVTLVALGAIYPAMSARAAPLAPERYMPPRAGVVIVWKNPAKTMDRLEALATRAGVAPPTAEPGWLRTSWTSEMPMMADLDLARPVWLALMPPPAGQGAEDAEPKGVLVLPIAGKGERLVESLKTEMSVAVKGSWLIAVHKDLPKRLLQPHGRPFALPKHLDRLDGASDVFGTVRVAAYPQLLEMGRDDAALADAPAEIRPILAAIQGYQNDKLAEMSAMTLGAGVATDGLNVFLQVHPEPKTELARQGRALKNHDGPLITGLPIEDYFIVGATRVPADAETNPLEDMLMAVLESSNSLDARVEKKAKELKSIADSPTSCSRYSMGLSVAGSIEALRMIATSGCASSEKMIARVRELVTWSADLVTTLAEAESTETPSKLRLLHEPKKLRVGEHELDVAHIDFPAEAVPAPDREAAQILQQPLVFGAVDAKTAIFAWNAPEPVLQRLATAAEKDAPLALPAATAARAQLSSPRHTESYIFAGPLVSAFAPADVAGMLGPLRFLMAQMPPVAVAIQSQPDGSQLYQMYLPQQLAQLAASVAQMQR